MSTSISKQDLFSNGIILPAYVGLMSGYTKTLGYALSIILTTSKCFDFMFEWAHFSTKAGMAVLLGRISLDHV